VVLAVKFDSVAVFAIVLEFAVFAAKNLKVCPEMELALPHLTPDAVVESTIKI
jgi:hypothetical protein